MVILPYLVTIGMLLDEKFEQDKALSTSLPGRTLELSLPPGHDAEPDNGDGLDESHEDGALFHPDLSGSVGVAVLRMMRLV